MTEEKNFIADAEYLFGMAMDGRNDSELFTGRCYLAMVAAQIATAKAAERQAVALEKLALAVAPLMNGEHAINTYNTNEIV